MLSKLLKKVKFMYVCTNVFFTDYINGGELFTHLYQREKFTENEVRIYIGEIVLALEHLHKVSNTPRIYVPTLCI